MLQYIFGLIYTIFYVILCKMFVEIFAEKRTNVNKWIRFLLFAGLAILEYMFSALLREHILPKTIVMLVLGTGVMWICFEQRLPRIALLVIFYHALGFTTDYVSLVLLNRFLGGFQVDQVSFQIINFLMGSFSQILLFCILLALMRFFKKSSMEMFTRTQWMRFTVFPVFTMVAIIAILANFEATMDVREKNVLLIIAFGLLTINILIYNLMYDMHQKETQIRMARLSQERVHSEIRMYQQISENYNAQKKREHEHRNHLMVITALAKGQKLDELNKYLAEFDREIAHKVEWIDTNHVIVNAILNTKYQEAREKGIVFVLKIDDLSGIRISDEDIVVILSNLLNNAIEACEKCHDKILKLKFVKENKQIVISVINSFAEEPVMIGTDYQTSKEDVFRHGVGIYNVKETVSKYNGSCVIKHSDNLFKFVIVIPE